jgi:hypothetical protein
VAQVKNYGLIGVGGDVQFGKLGPKLVANAENGTMAITNEGGAATTLSGADGVNANDFITKSQLDELEVNLSGSGFNILLGNIDANGDLDWHITPDQGDYDGNTSVKRQGAVTSFTGTTNVSDAIDRLNEATYNIYNDSFVRDVNFTVDNATGGAPLVSTLNISTTGNPTHYTINWGDGQTTTATTDSTPTHTYSDNSNSPFDVVVTAYNENGAGEGSTTSLTKDNFITLYTANPVADFNMYAGSSGGIAVTQVDDGTALYFNNDTSNIGEADATYLIEWGDGSADSNIAQNDHPGGEAGSRLAHTFTTSSEQEQTYTVKLTLSTHSTADPSVIPNNATVDVKVYDTHTPEVSTSATSGINEDASDGLQIAFTNNTENTIGSYADYGIQYRYNWGDGTTSTVNVGSNSAGDTGEAINHTYELSASEQANGTARDFVGNLEVISNHSSSPFKSSDFTIHVEPDVRATIAGQSTTASLKSSNDSSLTVYKGTDLSGTNRAVVTFDNTTQNGDSYVWNYGDGSNTVTVTETGSPAGSVAGANITHDYSSASTGNKTVTMTASGTPDITAQTDSDSVTVKVEDVPSAPAGVSSKTLSLSTSSNEGASTKLASGAVDTISSGLSAGDGLNTSTVRRYDSTTNVSTNNISDAYNSSTGTISARIDGVADGQKTFSTTTGETGTFTSLVITAEGDANDQISSSTYPKNFYQVFSGRVTKNISSLNYGIHSMDLSHSTTGDTNKVFIVKDNMTTTPSVDISSATLEEDTNGTLRYVSGVPYFNDNSATIKLVGATVTNLTGQAYLDSSSIFDNVSGTNTEGTSSSAITQASSTYAEIDGASSMLNSGIPLANVGVGGAYALGNISIDITNSPINSVETIKFRAQNMNGYGSFTSDHATKIQVWKATPSFDETAIPVSDSLGATHDDDAKRITGFSGTGDTPAIAGSTNFYTANGWSGAETIAGTSEAVMRFNTLQHFDTDLSSGYLPVGPDLSTGRSGAQYFTFAFRRTTMSNFDITLTGKVSGVFIAAPGTDIDDASTLNGWLDASTPYGGAGTPGADTGNGGNGSNGCAFTSGDKIVDGTNYNNESFTMTLGDQNATNSTGNNVLVRIKLEDGDSITALSIS